MNNKKMTQHNKNIKWIVLAASLFMLAGGIISSVYCSHRINERLDWAEKIGNPEYTKENNYQIVKDEVVSLGKYLGVSASIAITGAFAMLAVLFRKRFSWGVKNRTARRILGTREIPFLFGIFSMILGTFGAINNHIYLIFQDKNDEFRLLTGLFILACIGVAIIGFFISLGSILWPRQKTNKLMQ